MKTTITLLLLTALNLYATPDIEYLNPLEHPEEMSYRWCVKTEKSDKTRIIFQTFLEVKEHMRKNNMLYLYIQDCFVDETVHKVKYRRIIRTLKDDIHGENNNDNACNGKVK